MPCSQGLKVERLWERRMFNCKSGADWLITIYNSTLYIPTYLKSTLGTGEQQLHAAHVAAALEAGTGLAISRACCGGIGESVGASSRPWPLFSQLTHRELQLDHLTACQLQPQCYLRWSSAHHGSPR